MNPCQKNTIYPKESFNYLGYHLESGLFKNEEITLEKIARGLQHYLVLCFEYHRQRHAALLNDDTLCKRLNQHVVSGNLSEKLAVCLATGGRAIFDHCSVAMNSQSKGYRMLADHPLLDKSIIDAILGKEMLRELLKILLHSDEVFVTAKIQPVIRLSSRQLEFMDRLMLQIGLPNFEPQRLLSAHVLDSPWHNYHMFNPAGEATARVVNLCLPLEVGKFSNGCYRVIPESHLLPGRKNPQRNEVKAAKEVILNPGDGLFFSNNLFMDNGDCSEQEPSFVALNLQFVSSAAENPYTGFPIRQM